MTETAPKRKRYRVLKAVRTVLVVLVLTAAAAVWLACFATVGAAGLACWPPALHSRTLTDETLISSALLFEQKLQDVVNAKLSDLPVQVTVTAREVNGYCAALQRDDLWRQLRYQDDRHRARWKPKDLEDVRVSFRGNQAYIVGRLPNHRPALVLSVRVSPMIEPDGTVVFAVTGVRVGHLPIPRLLARKWFGHMTDTVFEQHGSWGVKHMGISGGRLYVWAGPLEE